MVTCAYRTGVDLVTNVSGCNAEQIRIFVRYFYTFTTQGNYNNSVLSDQISAS